MSITDGLRRTGKSWAKEYLRDYYASEPKKDVKHYWGYTNSLPDVNWCTGEPATDTTVIVEKVTCSECLSYLNAAGAIQIRPNETMSK